MAGRISPDQLVDQIRCGRREIVMNLLLVGLPIEEGWVSLPLLTDEVVPRG
jgi:hypothetical protein